MSVNLVPFRRMLSAIFVKCLFVIGVVFCINASERQGKLVAVLVPVHNFLLLGWPYYVRLVL